MMRDTVKHVIGKCQGQNFKINTFDMLKTYYLFVTCISDKLINKMLFYQYLLIPFFENFVVGIIQEIIIMFITVQFLIVYCTAKIIHHKFTYA